MAMDERELLAILDNHRRNSLGAEDSDLANERASAMDHYHGRPYGNEEVGRSEIVSRDLSETVDWALPAIIAPFIQGRAVEFMPTGPEDEQAASQESDAVNHVITVENPWFLVVHDWVKDALILKNGYVKHWWHEETKVREAENEGLTDDQMLKLLNDISQDGEEYELLEHEEYIEHIETEGPMGPIVLPVTLHDIKYRCTKKMGRVMIEPVPAEEIRVSKHCRGSLQKSPFTEHETLKTRSDLIEMGMDEDFVYSLSAHDERDNDAERLARDTTSNESDETDMSYVDMSMDMILYREAYVRIDFDGDRVAELRKIITVGHRLPEGDDWNEVVEVVGITSLSPKRVPHRHVGESLDDELQDLQLIKTIMLRQLIDNTVSANHTQYLINERVHLDDFLHQLPTGVKRVSGTDPIDGCAVPVPIMPVFDKILPVIDYVDELKENRSGVSPSTTGVDPDVLQNTTKGAFLENMNRATQKVQMITRMVAELGVKELVQCVHYHMMQHQDIPKKIKVSGSYIDVDPREWKERQNLVAKVGLGTGNEEEKRQKLMLLDGLQQSMMDMGIVGPEQRYEMFNELAENLGVDNPAKFVLQPGSEQHAQHMQQTMEMAQAQQQQGNPLAEAEMIKAQAKLQSDKMQAEMKMALEQAKMQYQYQVDLLKQQLDIEREREKIRSQEAIAAMREEIKALIEGYRIDLGAPGIGAGVQEQPGGQL